MTASQHPASELMPLLASEQRYQDHLITRRLPAWLRQAGTAQLAQLGSALRQALQARRRLQRVLAQVQPLAGFARTTLEGELQARLGSTFSLPQWRFIQGHREPVINAQPVGYHLTEVVYGDIPMLEAALRNFTAQQALSGGQPKGNRLTSATQGSLRPPSAVEFAQLCREIDLGGRYQRHLAEVFEGTSATSADSVPAVFASATRWSMLVDAHKARLEGVLNDTELQLITSLCLHDLLLRVDGAPVVAKRLQLLGCPLEQIVVLDIIDEGWLRNTSKRVLVYIPGDPHGAWSAQASLRQFARRVLGQRLRLPAYQQFFSRFVRRRDSQRFFGPVISGYADLAQWANIDLDEHMHPYPSPLFDHLARAQILQIKDDAAMIAVPTASIDLEVRREHDRRLAAQGWTLLNLAGFFVPLIGVGLLAMTAWQLLGEVFQGVDAWREGDDSEALDHLLNVATDLALVGVTTAGVVVASRAWQRSGLVDSMVAAQLENGTMKLWRQNLRPFQGTPPVLAGTRDVQDILHVGEATWIDMDGTGYPVRQRAVDGRWQLNPVDGHAPVLDGNGAGAWRLEYEQPAQWTDSYVMFRRLGRRFQGLDDERIDDVLTIHGMTADHVRALHVHGRVPEPELVDTVVRARLDQHVRRLVSDLRAGKRVTDTSLLAEARGLPGADKLPDPELAEQVWVQRRLLLQRIYERLQASDDAGVVALRRVFPTLHRRAAGALLRSAGAADLQRLSDTGRVPLRLAEAARASVLRIRVARVLEGLYLDTPQNADLARAVIGLLRYLPGVAQGVRWRLFEGSLRGPVLLQAQEGIRDVDLVHVRGQFLANTAQGQLIAGPGELFEVMTRAYQDRQWAAMGVSEPVAHNLRVLLARQAAQHRQQLAEWLGAGARGGWFRAPLRLDDGRLGYPLSGRSPGSDTRRGRPQALFARVRAVYPSFNDAQVLAWLNDLQRTGGSIDDELARLARELTTLEGHLQRWTRQAADPRQGDERRYLMESLVNCWQRRPAAGQGIDLAGVSLRFISYAVVPGNLPEFPREVSFAHIQELALLGMDLEHVPDAFIRAFPNLRVLELAGNRLSRLPGRLTQLDQLRELDLFNNQIVLDAEQAAMLAGCDGLEYLNLSHNPLGRGFDVSGMAHLRRLHLRATGINRMPPGLLDCPELLLADLRDNQLTSMPERFHRSPLWIRRVILLSGNPLTAAERQRLSNLLPGAASVEGAQGPSSRSPRQRWLDAADSLHRTEQSASWEDVQTEPRSADFFALLARLPETADFRRNARALAGRVFAMLQAMREHVELREQLFAQVTDNLTCQDSVALSFSELELQMQVWRAQREAGEGGRQHALLHLGRQLWRLEQVDAIAREDVLGRRASGGNPDELEVVLAYRLALRDTLALPAQPQDMLFAETARLDRRQVEQARQRVLDAESPETMARSLAGRAFWETHLSTVESERLDRLDAPYHERLAQLMGLETVPDNERLARMNQIRDDRQAARQALLFELTLARLQDPLP
ncbi:MAG: leucine-rich repeat domain-containing protein [Paucimonas sp.]|nr:leucine-rich repeat domain-containing protein [Paucimonas sp.]